MAAQPTLIIKDGFFADPIAARAGVLSGAFETLESPADGVSYPGICADVDGGTARDFVMGIMSAVQQPVTVNAIFARAMINGEQSPHKIHSDRIMGDYSAHVYLSEDWPDGAGTSFWTHRTEGDIHHDDTDLSAVSLISHEGWRRYEFCPGRFNRLLIHHANVWHMAEPHEGWGVSPETGRLVLTCFFRVP